MKLIRNISLYIGHLLTALLGSAILGTGFGMVVHPASIPGVIRREWILSVTVAGLLGFFAWHISKSRMALWIWILPAAWFALGVLSLLPTLHGQSALLQNRGLWYEISGLSCVAGPKEIGCRDFFLFTIPFLRCAAYSLGTFLAMAVAGGTAEEAIRLGHPEL